MSSHPRTNTCERCSQPYSIDDSTDTHMAPPTDYARGCGRFCLACWLCVGPLDFPEPGNEASRTAQTAL